MSWSALGGCDSAEISVQGDGLDIVDWQGYLAKPVEIFDELGRLRWWGAGLSRLKATAGHAS